MRNLLFLSLKAVSLEASDGKRILEIGMRLVSHNNIQDLRQLVRPTGYSTPAAVVKVNGGPNPVAAEEGLSTLEALEILVKQLRLAEIIIGHNIADQISIILAEARRAGQQDLIKLFTPPRFGYDLGECAAICTQQLVVDYFQHLGEPIHCSNTKLAGTHRRLFGEELVDGHDALVEAIACQRIYNFCSVFQQEQETTFLSDIVCLED